MKKATIYMRSRNTLYQGATKRGKSIEAAIMNAHNGTKNEWNLPSYAEVDGKKYNYEIYYNTETDRDEITIDEMEE